MLLFILILCLITLNADALSVDCLKARIKCYDKWAKVKDCNVIEDYNDCLHSGKQLGICPNNTIISEDIYDKSVDCGIIQKRKPPYVFPEFDDSHKYFARATNAFGELMYEYVNMSATYQEASDFCSLAGGSLFTARNAYNFISLDIRLLRRVVHIEEFWLGASDRIKEGNFRFEDGSPVLWNFFRMNEGKNDKSIFGFFRRRKRDCVLMNMLGVGISDYYYPAATYSRDIIDAAISSATHPMLKEVSERNIKLQAILEELRNWASACIRLTTWAVVVR
ncbi:hypothetical protein RRG08_033773 [Elysia crispata]|uniref:C-type lectin domain-containing protein n=1 Tax=Elysia crispata TaxID=231223 RepID=A0AAE1AS51_9GAST|nr:hypothetical protein RRG08_033773 [Elysia crispata]